MNDAERFLFAILFFITGYLLVKFNNQVGKRASGLYRKLGLEIPDELYAKQFKFIGILLVLFGLLIVTGLDRFI